MFPQSIDRLFQIVRHHKLSQLRLRVLTRVRRKLFDNFRAKSYPSVVRAPVVRKAADLAGLIKRHSQIEHHGSDWLDGKFGFLGDSRTIGMPPDWRLESEDVSHLWSFHLHYHDFLLTAFDGECLDSRAWDVVFDWIDNYPICTAHATSNGWHPFCISKRLVNWIVLWRLFPPTDRRSDVLGSIASQADFLKDHTEADLGGNHLIENAHALAVVSSFFDEGERWAAAAVDILSAELDEQFLPHGEHFERSPMYHKHMIVALQDIRDTIHWFCPATAKRCDAVAERAIDFLRVIRHQDGEIPLFGDAVIDDGPTAISLLDASDAPSETIATVGGYWIYDDNESRILFDRAPAGPDHLMGHTHADLLNVVCSIQGRRWIVDSGVFDYADTEIRQHCRSTAAHNVLEVDGQNQFDMWSGFRVGRRGWPTGSDEGSVEFGSGHSLEKWALSGHDAYQHMGLEVGRWIACGQSAICCVDWIEGSSKSEHQLVSRVHLHPDVSVEIGEGEVLLTPKDAETPMTKMFALNGEIAVQQGWYCPSFGVRIRNSVIEIRRNSGAPGCLGWLMSQTCSINLVDHQDHWCLLDGNGEEVFRRNYG